MPKPNPTYETVEFPYLLVFDKANVCSKVEGAPKKTPCAFLAEEPSEIRDAEDYFEKDARLLKQHAACMIDEGEVSKQQQQAHDGMVTKQVKAEISKYQAAVTVFGGSAILPSHPMFIQAMQLGREAESLNVLLIQGGGAGVMQALRAGSARHSECDAPKHSLSIHAAIYIKRMQDAQFLGGKRVEMFNGGQRTELLVDAGKSWVFFPGGPGTFEEFWKAYGRDHYQQAEKPLVLMNCTWWKSQLPSFVFDQDFVSCAESAEQAWEQVFIHQDQINGALGSAEHAWLLILFRAVQRSALSFGFSLLSMHGDAPRAALPDTGMPVYFDEEDVIDMQSCLPVETSTSVMEYTEFMILLSDARDALLLHLVVTFTLFTLLYLNANYKVTAFTPNLRSSIAHAAGFFGISAKKDNQSECGLKCPVARMGK